MSFPTSLTDDKAVETVGNSAICAWRVAIDACWVQVRSPELARRVAKLEGARRVASNHEGPFLRIYEVPHHFAWVRNYVTKVINENN